MTTRISVAQRLGRVLEAVTQQSGRLSTTPEYGSWLLGKVSDSPRQRRIRIQLVMTVLLVGFNLLGIGIAILLVTIVFPVPSVFSDAPLWASFAVGPGWLAVAVVVGTWWITRRMVHTLHWAIEGRAPNRADQQGTFLAPLQVAVIDLFLWIIGTVLLTTLYGLADSRFIPRFLFSVGFTGVVVATASYLLTEFALRPVAAQALEAGAPPRFRAGIMGRTLTVWLVGSGLPVIGIALAALFALMMHNLSETQFAVAMMILAVVTLIAGFLLMWILAWLMATPVRMVRAALQRVENGDLDCNVVVFDGTELGELQRGFNAMVAGLRQREELRDLFGRHVGREVAAAAEHRRPKLGGEDLHAAVVFVDMIGSTQLTAGLPAAEVVDMLNRFFAVIVDEVDRHHGLVNKFEGDAALAVFGAPVALEHPEDEALAAARNIAERLPIEMPECRAGIGVAAGQVVAGNVGAKQRFEYTVIGDPVNEAARLCELAKSTPDRIVASSAAVSNATEIERTRWRFGDTVTLRGYRQPIRLALLAPNPLGSPI